MSASKPARRWLGRLGLLAASTLLALVAGELALRAIGVVPERFAQPRSLEREDKRLALDLYPDDPRGYFPIDLRDARVRARVRDEGLPEVDARFRRTPHGVSLRFSEELCRGPAISARSAGGARVVVIGDSFTEGQGVREEDTFSARLDEALGPGVEVLNCGRRGFDFPDLSGLFTRRLALDPDVVVYAMLLNDPERSPAFQARQRYVDDWILDRRRMVSEGGGAPGLWQIRFVALLEDRIEGMRIGAETTRWYRDMVGAPNRDGWAATLDALSAMDARMRARGGELVVALWPLLVDLDGEYPFEAAHATIREGLARRSITLHDTLPAFRGHAPSELWVHAADRHPNERAHAIFAHALEPFVREALGRRRRGT